MPSAASPARPPQYRTASGRRAVDAMSLATALATFTGSVAARPTLPTRSATAGARGSRGPAAGVVAGPAVSASATTGVVLSGTAASSGVAPVAVASSLVGSAAVLLRVVGGIRPL